MTITAGLVNTNTTPKLLRLIEGGRLDPTLFATHRLPLADTEAAYDLFAAAAETHAPQGRPAGRPCRTPRRGARGGRISTNHQRSTTP